MGRKDKLCVKPCCWHTESVKSTGCYLGRPSGRMLSYLGLTAAGLKRRKGVALHATDLGPCQIFFLFFVVQQDECEFYRRCGVRCCKRHIVGRQHRRQLDRVHLCTSLHQRHADLVRTSCRRRKTYLRGKQQQTPSVSLT